MARLTTIGRKMRAPHQLHQAGRAPGAVQPPTPRAAGYRLIAFSTPKPPRRMPMIAPRRTKTLPPRWR